jgi:hypothetical protein
MKIDRLEGFDNYYEKDQPLLFCSDRITIHYDGIKVVLNKLPYLKNPVSNKVHFTTPAVHIINEYVSEAKRNEKKETTINQLGRFNRGKLPIGENTDFKYSPAEHFFIPDLIRDIPSDGYLTPVYFNKNVLVRYEHVDGYRVSSKTDSFGVIHIGENFTIAYGINTSGSIIMWLGDIVKLDRKEILYLYSENVEPQYNLHSDFYDNQILNKWL